MLTPSSNARFVSLSGAPCTPASRRGLFSWLNALIAAHKSRIALANLDQHGLEDVGLTRTDVEDDLARPVWDVPSQWRRC